MQPLFISEIDNAKMRVLKKLNNKTEKDRAVEEGVVEDTQDNCNAALIQECKV